MSSSQLIEYTCAHCDMEFDVRVYPAEPRTRMDPPSPADFDPGECPHCGTEIDDETVLTTRDDMRIADEEDRAEARREGK